MSGVERLLTGSSVCRAGCLPVLGIIKRWLSVVLRLRRTLSSCLLPLLRAERRRQCG